MTKKRILLPNPADYMDYINQILVESFLKDVPPTSLVNNTPSVAKVLVKQDTYLIVSSEDTSNGQ